MFSSHKISGNFCVKCDRSKLSFELLCITERREEAFLGVPYFLKQNKLVTKKPVFKNGWCHGQYEQIKTGP